ncbi:hypothetical protein R1flu_002964 [Riccia fluitans]|uniref:Cytochrome P450 n=1 Tax=Riccia fluitans TaxID=41844 RepID=A0ABD1YBE3_9MARC
MVLEEQHSRSTWRLQPNLTLVGGLVILLLLIIFKWRNSRIRLPPGPRGWPVVGCLLLLGRLPHQTFALLAKKYGPLMFMKVGSMSLVIVSSPKVAEEVLKTHNKIWTSRYATTAVKIMNYGGKDLAFTEYGPRWRYARRLFLTELVTAKRFSFFQNTRKEEILRGVAEAINVSCGGTKPVRMDLILSKVATNTVLRMLMNEGNLSDEASAIKNSADFQQTFKEVFKLSGLVYLGDFIPWLDPLDPKGLKKRMHALSKRHDEFLQRILDDHKLKLEAAERNQAQDSSAAGHDESMQDMVYTLLTRPRDDGQHLSDPEIKGIMRNVILAGTDTNSATAEWALSELLRNPRILQKAQAEMDSVVGRERFVEEADLPHLPELNAICKETFRLHPAAPLISRVSAEYCEVHGYRIPAKTRLFVNIYAIQRDPEVYDRPTEFYPERFVGSGKDVHGVDFDLLPFGSGARKCPGKGLALLLVHFIIALFVQSCELSLPGNLRPEELDVEETPGAICPRLNPLQVVVVPRLPEYVMREVIPIEPNST